MEKIMKVLGQEVTVKSFIPYATKVEMAEEYVARGSIFDEDRGVAYWTYLEEAVEMYIFLKAYTGLDMSKYDSVDGMYQLMDELAAEDISELKSYAWNDYMTVIELTYKIFDSAALLWKSEHSVGYNVLKSFGFLFDGRDLTETLAQAREVNEQMIDHLGAISKQKPLDISQYAKKKK